MRCAMQFAWLAGKRQLPDLGLGLRHASPVVRCGLCTTASAGPTARGDPCGSRCGSPRPSFLGACSWGVSWPPAAPRLLVQSGRGLVGIRKLSLASSPLVSIASLPSSRWFASVASQVTAQ